MNIYATNNIETGYEFAGSFDSVAQAVAWATARGLNFAHWWAADDGEGEDAPDWANFPSD